MLSRPRVEAGAGAPAHGRSFRAVQGTPARRPSWVVALAALVVAAACGTGPAPHAVGEPARAPAPSALPAGRVVPVGHGPEGVAVDPSTGLVAVALRAPDEIAVLDPDGRVLRRIAVPSPARHLRFAAPAGPLLAPLERSGILAVIDVQAGVPLARVPLQRQPHDAVAVSGRVFVSNEFSDTLAVVESGRVLRELSAPAQPGGVAAAGEVVGVLGVRSHQLEVYDAGSLRSLGAVGVGAGPTHVAGSGDRLYVVDTLGEAVLVLTAAPRPVLVARASAPGRPYGVAVDTARQHLWVTETATNRLTEYDVSGSAPRLLTTFPTVGQPNSVAVDERTGRAYVTGGRDGLVQVVQPA